MMTTLLSYILSILINDIILSTKQYNTYICIVFNNYLIMNKSSANE